MSIEQDKDKVPGIFGGPVPVAVGQMPEPARAGFASRMFAAGGSWAKKNPAKTTIVAAIIGPVIAQRAVVPAYDWAKAGIVSLFSKKAEDKIAAEAKNAMSVGDVIGLVASSVGKLVKATK